MKTLKKGLSWLLVTVMVLTTFFFADLGIDVSALLDVTTLTTKLEPTIKFYVPETVYLNPVKGVGGQPYAFQYFVDCQSNGTLNVSPNQTSGLIYLSCTMPMTNVQISAGSGTTLSLQSQTDSSQVKAWTVTEQSTTSVYDGPISITATFTADGKTYTQTAFMYAYYPNLDNLVGVAGGYTYQTSVGNEPDFAGFPFLAGLHYVGGTEGAFSNYYDQYNTTSGKAMPAYAQNPLVGWPTIAGQDEGTINSYQTLYQENNSAYIYNDGSAGEGNYLLAGIGGIWYAGRSREDNKSKTYGGASTVYGHIYADISRFSNLNQVPNLKAGVMVHGTAQSSDSHKFSYASTDGNVFIAQDVDYPNDSNGIYRGLYSLNSALSSSAGTSSYTMQCHVRMERSSSSGVNIYYQYGLSVIRVNKAALRTALRDSMEKNWRSSYAYSGWSTAYNSLITARQSAFAALGKPYATQSEVNTALTNLNNAMTACQNIVSANFTEGENDALKPRATFYAPETIYLTPHNGRTGQYFYGVSTSGTAEQNKTLASATSARIYFKPSNFSGGSVTISVQASNGTNSTNWTDVATGNISSITFGGQTFSSGSAAASGKSWTISGTTAVDTTCTALTLAAAPTEGGYKFLRWQAAYTVNGRTYYTYAYTICYNPFTQPIAAATRIKNDNGPWHATFFLQTVGWVVGIHSHNASGGKDANSYLYYLQRFATSGWKGDPKARNLGNTGVEGAYLQNVSLKNANYLDKELSENSTKNYTCNAPTGYLTVDTSRFTNYDYLPFFYAGNYVTDTEGTEDAGYVQVYNTTSDKWVDRSPCDRQADPPYESKIRGNISTGTFNVTGFATKGRSGGTTNITSIMPVSVTAVNKATIRSTYYTAVAKCQQPSWYATGYNTYQNSILDLAIKVGDPDNANASGSANEGELARASGTSTVTHVSSGTNYNGQTNAQIIGTPVETKSFNYGDWVYAYYDNIPGYTATSYTCYNGSTNLSSYVQGGSAQGEYWIASADFSPVTWTFTYAPKTYTVTYNLNKGSGSSTPSFDGSTTQTQTTSVTYHSKFTVGSKGGVSKPAPTRTGYDFAGWLFSATGAIVQHNAQINWTYPQNETFTAQWDVRNYVVEYDNEFHFGQWVGTGSFGISAAGSYEIDSDNNRFYYTSNSAGDNYTLTYDANDYTMTLTPGHQYRMSFNCYLVNNVDGEWERIAGSPGVKTFWFTYTTAGGTDYTGGYGSSQAKTYDSETGLYHQDMLFTVPAGRPYVRIRLGNTGAMTIAYENIMIQDVSSRSATGLTASDYAIAYPPQSLVSYDKAFSTATGINGADGLATTSIKGYTFQGWYTGKNGTGTNITSSTSMTSSVYTGTNTPAAVEGEKSIHLWSKWTPTTYTISYNLNGSTTAPATNGAGNPTSYTIESATINLAQPTRTGFDFTGWTGSNGTTPQTSVSIPSGSTGNKSYTANWSAHKYNIVFNGNGASGILGGSTASINNVSYDTWVNLTANGFTMNIDDAGGWHTLTFQGWDTSPAGTTVVYSNQQSVINLSAVNGATVNLYAVWGKSPTSISGTTRITADGTSGFIVYASVLTAAGVTLHSTNPVYTDTVYSSMNLSTGVQSDTVRVFDYLNEATGKVSGVMTNGTSVWKSTILRSSHNNSGGNPGSSDETKYYKTYVVARSTDGSSVASRSGTTAAPPIEYLDTAYFPRVTFDSNGGSAITLKTQNGTGTTLPNNYYYAGYGLLDDGDNNPSDDTQFNYYGNVGWPSANPTKTYYDFKGWYTTPTGTTQVTAASPIRENKDHTIYAQYTLHNYTITYNLGGTTNSPVTNNVNNPATYTYEDAVTIYPPSRPGYTFEGWTGSWFGGTLSQPTIAYHSSGNKTLTATWSIINYTITYTMNGGTNHANNPSSYNIENAAITIQQPTKTGYTFTGWTGSNGTTPQTSVTIPAASTGNKTYTANWTPNTNTPYKVEHYIKNTSGSYPSTPNHTDNLTGTSDATVVLVDKKNSSYEVLGGIAYHHAEVDGTTVTSTTIKPNGSLVIKLYYDRSSYAVTLAMDTGISTVTGSGTYYYGASVSLNATLATGYEWDTVNGWSVTSGQTSAQAASTTQAYNFTMPTGAVYLTANARPITYTISYTLNGGAATNNTTYTVETPTFTLNNPTRTGYIFAGWTGTGITGSSTSVQIAQGSTGNRSYTATWTAITYTLKYNPGDGGSGTVVNQTITYDDSTDVFKTVAQCGFTKTGYTFVNWNTNANGSGTTYTAGAGIPNLSSTNGATVNIYAIWSINSYTLTANVSGGGGIIQSIKSGTTTISSGSDVAYNSTVTIRAQANTGYHFVSWGYSMPTANITDLDDDDRENENEGVETYYGIGQSMFKMPASDITVTATFAVNKYTVTLLQTSATTQATTTSVTATYGSAMPAISSLPSRTGYTFDGYQYGATKYYKADGTSNNNWNRTSNTELSPIWSARQFTLSFNANGGSCSLASKTVVYDSPYGAEDGNGDTWPITANGYVVTRTGYNFAGWFTSATGGTEVTAATIYQTAGNSTVYAHWTAIDFTLKVAVSGSGSIYSVTKGGADIKASATSGSGAEVACDSSVVIVARASTGYHFTTWSYVTAPPAVTLTPTEEWIDQISDTADEYYRDGKSSFLMPAGDVTVTANFAANTYTVSFQKQSGTGGTSSTVATYNASLPSITPPTRTGYTFGGYYDQTGGAGVQYYSASGTGVITWDKTVNSTLYAKWTIITYNISYTLGGGSATNPATYNVETPTFTLTNPTRTGYNFAGWTGTGIADSSTSVTIAQGSTGDRSYTATWNVITYNITYTLGGGTNHPNNPPTYTIESAQIALQPPTRTGYTFTGWTGSNGTTKQMLVVIPAGSYGDKSYTANWDPNSTTPYTVEHYVMNTSGVYPGTATATTGGTGTSDATLTLSTCVNPDLLVPNGIVYSYGTVDDIETTTTTIRPDGLLVVKLYYERRPYNVTLTAGYGINSVSGGATNVLYGAGVNIDAVVKTGYTWNNWTYTSGGAAFNSVKNYTGTMPAGNLALTANATLNTYNISYTLNGGTIPSPYNNPTSYTVESANITLVNPVRTGYTFLGWSGTGITDKSMSVTIPAGSTGSRSYTANWAANTNTPYTVSHYLMNTSGTGYALVGEPVAHTGITGDTLTLSDLKDSSITVVGGIVYHHGTDGTLDEDNNEVTVTTTTIKADGSRAIKLYYDRVQYTITLTKGTGITAVTGEGTYRYGAAIEINATVATGYTWSAWTYTTGGATFSTTKNYTSTMPANNLTLTATTTKNIYTITYHDSIDATNPNRTTYTVTDSFTISALSKPGYTFDGWTGSNGSVKQQTVYVASGSTGDLEFTANWTKHTNTPYVVKHFVMTTDGAYDESNATLTENLTGPTDEPLLIANLKKTSAAYNTPNGIAYEYATLEGSQTHIDSTTIAGDGSRIIRIYYKRFDHDVTLTKGTGVSAVTGAGTYYYGAAVQIRATFETGYSWSEWTVTSGQTSAQPASTTRNYDFSMPAGDVNLTANATVTNYTISYTLNGGTLPSGYPQSYTYFAAAALMAPTRTGYTFVGWTGSNGGTPQTSVTIPAGSTGNKSYTANWSAISYTISYTDAQGATNSNRTSYTIEDTPFTIGALSKTGYTFDGWTGSNGETPQTTVTVAGGTTGNLAYTANWTANVNTLTIGVDEGSIYYYTGEYMGTVTATVSDVPIIEDAADISSEDSQGSVAFGTLVELTATSVRGFYFTGWNIVSGGITLAQTPNASFYMPDDDVIVTASFDIVTYTIVFDKNAESGVTGTVNDQIVSYYGDMYGYLMYPDEEGNYYERVGYDLIGWAATPTGSAVLYGYDDISGESDCALTPVNGETVTLYAVWGPINYVVKYYANLNDTAPYTGEQTVTQTVAYDETAYYLPANTFTRPGYSFAGWTDARNSGSQYFAGASFINLSSQPTTINRYAKWSINSYTVTFNRNGYTDLTGAQTVGGIKYVNGTSANWPANVSLNYDSTFTLPGDGFGTNGYFYMNKTNERRYLIGWTDVSGGTTVKYDKGETFTVTDNITLYAVWSADYYPLDTALTSFQNSYITYSGKTTDPITGNITGGTIVSGLLPASSVNDPNYASGGGYTDILEDYGYFDGMYHWVPGNPSAAYNDFTVTSLTTLENAYAAAKYYQVLNPTAHTDLISRADGDGANGDIAAMVSALNSAVSGLVLEPANLDEYIDTSSVCAGAGHTTVTTSENYPPCETYGEFDNSHSFNSIIGLCDDIFDLFKVGNNYVFKSGGEYVQNANCIYTTQSVEALYNAVYKADKTGYYYMLYDSATGNLKIKIPSQYVVRNTTRNIADAYHDLLQLKSADYTYFTELLDDYLSEYWGDLYPGTNVTSDNMSSYFTEASILVVVSFYDDVLMPGGSIVNPLTIVEQDYVDDTFGEQLKDYIEALVPKSASYVNIFKLINDIPHNPTNPDYIYRYPSDDTNVSETLSIWLAAYASNGPYNEATGKYDYNFNSTRTFTRLDSTTGTINNFDMNYLNSTYTAASVSALREAIDNIDWTLNSFYQAGIDETVGSSYAAGSYARILSDAIAGLTLKTFTVYLYYNYDRNLSGVTNDAGDMFNYYTANYFGGPSFTFGSQATFAPGTLTRAGYTFMGWSDDPGAIVENSTYATDQETGAFNFAIYDDVTLYAVWTINTLNVQMDPNGGTFSSGDNPTSIRTVPLNFGATYVLPNGTGASLTLSRAGYTFAGWSIISDAAINNGVQGDESSIAANGFTFTMGAGNAVVQASWTPKQYSIVFDSNGGSGTMASMTNLNYGQTYTLTTNAFTPPTGHSFAGWNTAANGSGTSYTDGQQVTSVCTCENGDFSRTLYAQWSVNSYSLTMAATNGTATAKWSGQTTPVSSGSVPYNAEVTIAASNNTGYHFTGWTVNPSGVTIVNDKFMMPAANLTVTASFEINTYYVSFHGGTGATGSMSNQDFVYNVNEALNANAFSKTGHSFIGWATSAGSSEVAYDNCEEIGSENGNALTTAHNVIVPLYAVWSINSYTLTIDNANGTQTTTQVQFGAQKSLSQPSRTGYIFNGWVIEMDGTYTVASTVTGNSVTMGDGDATVTAQWTPIKYTIAFNAGEGATGSLAPMTDCEYGESYYLTLFEEGTMAKTGHYFVGWELTISENEMLTFTDGEEVSNLTAVDGATVTLYAQWEAEGYDLTIMYDDYYYTYPSAYSTSGEYYLTPDDGQATSVKYGTEMQLDCLMYCDGYHFVSWYVISDATVEISETGVFTMPAAEVIIQPVVAVNTYIVSFDAYGGSGTKESESFTYDDYVFNIPVNDFFTKTGYEFLGWATYPGGYVDYYDGGMIFADGSWQDGEEITLYAVWSAIDYTLVVTAGENGSITSVIKGSSENITSDATGGGAAVNYNDQIAITAAADTGYHFTGWTVTEGGATLANASAASTTFTMPAADVTIEAGFEANTYTITFSSPNATTPGTGSTVATYGQAMPAITPPARTGYTFTGYYTATSGGTKYYNGDGTSAKVCDLTANTTLHAQWSINGYGLTLTVEPSTYGTATATWTGQAAGVTSGTVNYNDTVTITAFANTGYHFVKWEVITENATLGNINNTTTTFTMPASDVTVKASFAVNSYTVRFHMNEGSGTQMDDQLFSYHTSQNLSLNTYTRTGFEFLGWSKSQTATTPSYTDGQSIGSENALTPTHGDLIILYAVWDEIDYTLTIDLDDGSTPTEITLNYNDEYNLTMPTRTGYVFSEWTISTDESATVESTVDEYGTVVMGDGDTTVTAVWTPRTYSIYFNGNGATSGATASMTNLNYGQDYQLSANGFTRTGHTFAGWNTQANGSGTSFSGGATVNSLCTGEVGNTSITLYAQWTLNSNDLTITVEPSAYGTATATWAGQSTGVTSGTVSYNTTVSLSAVANTGYHFVVWEVITENATLGDIYSAVTTFTMPDADVTVKALFAVNTYTVSFNGNQATGGTMTNQEFSYFTPQNLKTNGYVRTGYLFLGWALSGDATVASFADGAELNSNNALTNTHGATVTIYAVWSKQTYTLTIDPDNESATTTQSLAYGATYMLPTVTKRGYTYNGWAVTEMAETATVQTSITGGNSLVMGDGDTTVTAQYVANTYTITFNANGGSGSMNDMICTYDVAVSLTPNAFTAVSGLNFDGWNTKADGTGTTYQNGQLVVNLCEGVTGDNSIVLYAQWSANSYTLTLTVESGAYGTATATWTGQTTGVTMGSVHYNDTVYLKAVANTGYHFVEWSIVPGSGSASITDPTLSETSFSMPANNLTLKANFAINQYRVAFSANGGSGTAMETQYFTYNVTQALSLNTYSRAGYTFIGWSLSASGTVEYVDGAEIGSTNAVTEQHNVTVTLYAVWDEISYVLTIDPDNGTAVTTYDVEFGENFTIPEGQASPTKLGYTFSHWTAISAPGATIPATISYSTIITVGDSDVTAKAIYTANTYTIAFNANGGTGSMSSIPATYDVPVELPENEFTAPEGKVFSSWNTAADGSGTAYNENQEVSNLASANGATVTLYAQWIIGNYTLTFDPTLGSLLSGEPNKKTISFGSTFLSGPSISATPVENYWPSDPTLSLTFDGGAEVSFQFLGWYNGTEDELGNVTYGTLVTTNSLVLTTGDRTVYAKWAATGNDIEVFETTISDAQEINLNHYDEAAIEALDDELVELFGEDHALNQLEVLTYKAAITSAYEELEQSIIANDGAGPKINVFETKDKQLSELNDPAFGRYLDDEGQYNETTLISQVESLGDISYVFPGKAHYTYYCYTNNESPLILVNIADVAGTNGRVSYPTMAQIDTVGTNASGQKRTRTGTVLSGWMQYTSDTPETATDRSNDYEILDMTVSSPYASKYTYAGSACGGKSGYEYYGQSQYIVLRPTFDNIFSGNKQYALYTITAYDDSYESLVASQTSLAGAGEYGSFATGSSIATSTNADITPNNTVTIYVEYKNVTGFDGTDCGGQIEGTNQPGGYLQCYTKYSAEKKFQTVDYLYRISGGATNDELLLTVPDAELATKYVANDPQFGQTNLGNFYQMVPSDSEVVAKYFEVYDQAKSGGATEAEATKLAGRAATALANAEIKAKLESGAMTAAMLKNPTSHQIPGEYYIWPQANASFMQTYCPAPTREHTLVYVHLADRWGNEFTSVVRRDYLDKSSPTFTNIVTGSITVNEYGGATIKHIKILTYTKLDTRHLVNVQPYSATVVDYSWNVADNTLTVTGLDPNLNSGMYVLYVEDHAGINNSTVIRCDSEGRFTITICDEYMPQNYQPTTPEDFDEGVEPEDLQNETGTAEAPPVDTELSVMTIETADADEAGGNTLEPNSELTVENREIEEVKAGNNVNISYSFTLNEVYTVNLFTRPNRDYNITLKSTKGGSIRTYVNNQFVAPQGGKLLIPGGSNVQVKIITYSGYELSSLTLTDSAGTVTPLDGSYTAEIYDDVTITAYFVESTAYNTVTVNNGTVNGKDTVKVSPYTQVIAIANKAPEGKVFAYWASGGADGSIVSYDEVYMFYATADVTLTAVYTDESVAVQPSIVMDPASASHITTVNGKYSLAYSGKLTIPAGYTLVEFGLVLSNQPSEYYTDENFVIGGSINGVNTVKIKGESLTEQGQFKINVNGVAPGATRAGRMYMVCKDAQNNEVLIYSSTWSVLTTPAD